MQNEVSSCVWHDDAITFNSNRLNSNQVWSSQDLVDLLKAGNHQIDSILREVCNCTRGKAERSFGKIPEISGEFSIYGNILHIAASENNNNMS